MRLHAGPGRGGRGLPWLVKPKYLSQKPSHNHLDKHYVDSNNFYEVLEKIEETKTCQGDNRKSAECIEANGKQEKKNKKNDQRKNNEKIPDSQNLTVGFNENEIAPNIGKKSFDFTTVVRKKRKKKYNVISPAQYYQDQPPTHKLESKLGKSVQEIKCWKNMTTKLDNHDEENGMREANTQDIEMEVADIEEDSIRNGLWNEIKKISMELDLPIPETSENSIETLEEALERLESKKVVQLAFSKTTKNAQQFVPTSQQSDVYETNQEHVTMVSPEGNKKQKNNHGILVHNLEVEKDEEIEKEHEERRENMIQIIKEVAKSIQYTISTQEACNMKSWDMVRLRKKLGEINVCKKKHQDSESISKNHTTQANMVSNHKRVKFYDETGLNVAAVSNIITPMKNNAINACKPPEVEKIVKDIPMKHQMRHSYTARLRLHVTDSSVNMGLMLKKMYQLWKETDPSAILLAHADETNNALMIDDINKVPSEEKEVKKYIMPGMFQNKGKLHMSIRMSGHLELPTLKSKIFAWMGRNKSFATIDRVQAALVHTIGFLHYVHPDFYNRENIKKEITAFLSPLKIGDDVNVFARKIWMRDEGKKIETRAMVVEVPKDFREAINSKMMEFQLSNCEAMTYIPFSQMADASYNSTLKQIFLSQNVYLHRTQRRNIYGVQDPLTKYEVKDGTKVSFCEWIESITYGDEQFLDACVVGPTGTLHLIYDEKQNETVQQLFGKGFKEYAQEHFKEEDLKKIFGSEKMRIDGNKNGATKLGNEYAEFLKRKFQGNPQDVDNAMRHSGTSKLSYADASRAPPSKAGRMNLHYSKFSEANPIELNVQKKKAKIHSSDEKTINTKHIEVMLNRLEKLEEDSKTSPNQWENEMDRRLTEKMNQFKAQFDAKLEHMEEQTDQRLRKSEELIVGKLQEMQIQNTANITKSFDMKMNEMGHKLDTYMTMFMAKIESTSATEHKRSAFVTGKCG